MTNAELIEIMKNDDPNAQVDLRVIYGNGEFKPVNHGKWIRVNPLQADDGGAFMCSVCRSGDWDIKDSYKFCPNCGADMREVKNENQ